MSSQTIYELLRTYQHHPLDPSLGSYATKPIPPAYLYPTLHRIGSDGIHFKEDPHMADGAVRDLLALLIADAPSSLCLDAQGKESEKSAAEGLIDLIDGPFRLLNHVLHEKDKYLSPFAVGTLPCLPQWSRHSQTGAADSMARGVPNGVFFTSTPEHGTVCGIAVDSDVQLGDTAGGHSSALDLLERWATKKHVLSREIFIHGSDSSQDVVTERLHEAIRSMMQVCTSKTPFLYVLSTFTECLILCVRPPTQTEPYTTIKVSTRYQHQRTGPMMKYKNGQIRVDTSKVSMTTVLLALSVRDSRKPLRLWNLPFVWPDELEVSEWAGGSEVKSVVVVVIPPSKGSALGKRKRVSAAGQRSSKRLISKDVKASVIDTMPRAPILKTIVAQTLTKQLAKGQFDTPLQSYHLEDNLSFTMLPVDKHRGIKGAYLAIRPSSEINGFDLDFECHLSSDAFGDTYLAGFSVDEGTPIVSLRAGSSGGDQEEERSTTSEEARASILEEARFYLGPLAETDIAPQFLGLWTGKAIAPQPLSEPATYDDLEILLLVTEHLPFEFDEQKATSEDWQGIVDLYAELGELGIEHVDVEERHWRGRPGDWHLIDFDKAQWTKEPARSWKDTPEKWAANVQNNCEAELAGVKASASAWLTHAGAAPRRASQTVYES